MSVEVMRRKASDNPYLHRDFHAALSRGIDYVERVHGPEAVREFLWRFTQKYYAPLRSDLAARGLAALRDHFERIYALEGAAIRTRLTSDELVVEIDACPAVAHLRANGLPVARLFLETSRTVNEALCEGTPWAAELASYREADGRSVQRFFRRHA